MTDLVARIRGLHGTERGMTLSELAVSLMLLGVVSTIFVSILFSVQNDVMRQGYRSQANDQARLALEQMDREIRSGNVLYDPAQAFSSPTCGGYACPAYFSVRVHTQANAPTRTPAQQCVQWLIQDRKLMRRAWAPGAATSLSGWRTVATGVVNRNVSPAVPAFTLDSTPGSRVLQINLLVNPKLESSRARTLRLGTSIGIRNSSSSDPCSPIPIT